MPPSSISSRTPAASVARAPEGGSSASRYCSNAARITRATRAASAGTAARTGSPAALPRLPERTLPSDARGGHPLGGPDARRSPRRCPLRRPPRRPGGACHHGCGRARRRPRRRDRGRLPGLREPGRRGQPQRRTYGVAPGGPAGLGRRSDPEPAVRVRARRRDRGLPCGAGGRRRPVRGRRRRVDEPRSARHGQARARVPARRPDRLRHDARMEIPNPRMAASSRSNRWAKPPKTSPNDIP